MKGNLFALSIAFLLVMTFAGGAHAASQDIQVVLTSQNPYPVQPDNVVTIEVSIQNDGYGDAENIVFEINAQSPFTLLPGEEASKTFKRIPARDQVTSSYKIYVDKDAISNNYELEFQFYQQGQAVKTTQKVAIEVQGKPKLVLDDIVTSPEEIEPGDTVTMTARIKNVGTGSASFMEAALVPNTTYILPVLSGGSDYVGEIKPGETGEAKFVVNIDNSAEYKTYSGTLSLSYKDDSGDSQSASFALGIPIRGKPIIEILSAKTDNGAYKVDIENIGTASAKALKVMLVQAGDVKDSAIANEIDPSKHKTFRLYGFSYGDAVINISYLDENNEFFSQENLVSIRESSSSEETQGGGASPLLPVLIVVVVLESYYVWRLRKRSRK